MILQLGFQILIDIVLLTLLSEFELGGEFEFMGIFLFNE